MIKPMLAVPMSKGKVTDWNDWVIERKYDGHRLIVRVQGSSPQVQAWTRPRKHAGSDGKTMAPKALPPHLIESFRQLPVGIYDGELLGGQTSTDVTRTELQSSLRFVVFDLLELQEESTLHMAYYERRALLTVAVVGRKAAHIELAEAHRLTSQADVEAFVTRVWEEGGEGAIIKRREAPYRPGKRSPDFIKVKKLMTTVCTVVGFEPTRGTVLDRGPFATVVLEDANGRRTSVKTKDDYELAQFNKHRTVTPHPAIGRKLRIEYQDIAADGGYRHPRWDRWEEE